MRAAGRVYTRSWGVAPDRSFVIEWRGVPRSTSRRRSSLDFQVQLNEDGVNRHPATATSGPDPRERGNSATVGIENATGTVGSAVFVERERCCPTIGPSGSYRRRPGSCLGTLTDANDGVGRSRARRCAHCRARRWSAPPPRTPPVSYRIRLIPGVLHRRGRPRSITSAPPPRRRSTTAGQTVGPRLQPRHRSGGSSVSDRSPSWPTPTSSAPRGSPFAPVDQRDHPHLHADRRPELGVDGARGRAVSTPGTSKTLTVRADPTDLAGGVHPGA